MSRHLSSSGNHANDPYKYLESVPRSERIRTEIKIIRTGHLGKQSYKNVTMKLKGEIIYSQDL